MDELGELLNKLFDEPDENQNRTVVLAQVPKSQRGINFASVKRQDIPHIDKNVRQTWRRVNIDSDTQPHSKYLQQFDKRSYNKEQNWRTVSNYGGSKNIQDSEGTSSSGSYQWRSPRRQLEASTKPIGNRDTERQINRNSYTANKKYKNINYKEYTKDLKLLIQLNYLEPEQLCQTLSDEKFVFLDILDTDVSLNQLVLLLQIMDKLYSSTFNDYKIKMITQSCDKNILNKIKNQLIRLPIQDSIDRNMNEYFWKEPEKFWINLCNFYENLFTFMPNTACDLLPKMVNISLMSFDGVSQYHEINISSTIVEKFENLLQRLSAFIDQEETKKYVEVLEPPDDFRLISPYPSIAEITTRYFPFIRPIITEGAYQSVHHYLDVQYRLLREDFVASLRNGICSYLEKGYSNRYEKQYDVRIYEKVRFVQPCFVHNRIAQLVQYSNTNRKISPEDSKHFMYGSLVCFTNDNFKTVLFGTVVNNEIKFLQKEQIVVDVYNIRTNCNYTMVECNVFFDPYYHVLKSLKKMDGNDFPFQKYIIDVSPDISHPKYITNLTSVYYNNRTFRILSPKTWPSADQIGLNVSQYKAFQSALTQEFCIIQGPPGTGKTYTSLKIAEFILSNRYNYNYSGPILVVCLTNHALDQFIEGLFPFTDRILRIGGRSKNEKIKGYSLKYYQDIIRNILKNKGNICYENYDQIIDENSYLDIMEYEEKLIVVGNCNENISVDLMPLREHLHLIETISTNEEIIDFKYLQRIDRELIHSWFSGARKSDIIDWLMEGVNENIRKDHHLQEVNNFYVKANDMNRKQVTVDGECFVSLNMYRYEKKRLIIHIAKLKPEGSKRQLLHLTRLIRKLDCKEKYLKWRLDQFNITDDIVKPENVDYNHPQLLTPDERWTLYRYWIKMLHTKLCDDVPNMFDSDSDHYNHYQRATDTTKMHIMERMHVIGMTTTGAAKHYDILQQLKCPIVIVEEAAEVLEAHVVTSLSKDCQHLILIGDHKQLRPNTAQYVLAKKYNLEISLFERMVRNGIHCQKLEVQHRMRPEISRLIVPAIYSKLDDADNVHLYLPVLGVTNSVYFITHTQYENTMHDSSSHKNVFEAIYLLKLASYLLKQGYTSEDITILTTYSGQMFCLSTERDNNYPELCDINITVVDNFQGEESKIVLLSLVRSNADANIGFLKTENRVCVALSRAKEGLYIIGNMNNLEASSTIWPKIKKTLEEQDSIGAVLKLRCQPHENLTDIKTLADFENVPNGGCHLPCDTILQCGHTCRLRCHAYDPEHEVYFCEEKCKQTICTRNHECPNPCGADCNPCIVLVDMDFPCGHKNAAPCSTKLAEYKCTTLIHSELPCGHSMDIKCHEDPKEATCINQCGKTLNCGHICIDVCHMGKDEDHREYNCKEPCTRFKKDCSVDEHMCDLLCNEPCRPCEELVKKRRTTCTHVITVQCNANADDTICREKCRKMLPCGHYCPMKCFEPCGNCPVQVTKTIEICGHSLKVNCEQEPDRQLCEEQCPLILKCGHGCRNKCNESCTVNCDEIVNYGDTTSGEERKGACYLKPTENQQDE